MTRDLDPALDRRIAELRQPGRELVIGDFDQDGGVLSRFGPLKGLPAITQSQFLPRSGCPILLVDLDGRLGVRKEFGRGRGRFVQEIEALVRLDRAGCPVPSIMNVDWGANSLTVTFVPGDVVRELLALAGAELRDRDPNGRHLSNDERILSGRKFVAKVISRSTIRRVAAGLHAIHAAGFVLEDVKFGNIILKRRSLEPVFVDLERAIPTDSLPQPVVEHLRQIDLSKFREHFGCSAENARSFV